MNNLSWIIYGADVAGHAKNAIGFIAFIAGLFSILGSILGFMMTTGYEKETIDAGKSLLGFCKKLFVAFWILITINIIIPSRQTIILIASSQYGEMVLNNPKINEIVDPSIDLLKTWIEKEKHNLLVDEQEKDKK